jgi:hypothetical protein
MCQDGIFIYAMISSYCVLSGIIPYRLIMFAEWCVLLTVWLIELQMYKQIALTVVGVFVCKVCCFTACLFCYKLM